MLEFLADLGKQIDTTLSQVESVPAKLIVIFFMWLLGAIPLFLIGVAGAYVAGALTMLSVLSNIIWLCLCGYLMYDNGIAKIMETNRNSSRW